MSSCLDWLIQDWASYRNLDFSPDHHGHNNILQWHAIASDLNWVGPSFLQNNEPKHTTQFDQDESDQGDDLVATITQLHPN